MKDSTAGVETVTTVVIYQRWQENERDLSFGIVRVILSEIRKELRVIPRTLIQKNFDLFDL